MLHVHSLLSTVSYTHSLSLHFLHTYIAIHRDISWCPNTLYIIYAHTLSNTLSLSLSLHFLHTLLYTGTFRGARQRTSWPTGSQRPLTSLPRSRFWRCPLETFSALRARCWSKRWGTLSLCVGEGEIVMRVCVGHWSRETHVLNYQCVCVCLFMCVCDMYNLLGILLLYVYYSVDSHHPRKHIYVYM